jgi:hypothetical protein
VERATLGEGSLGYALLERSPRKRRLPARGEKTVRGPEAREKCRRVG